MSKNKKIIIGKTLSVIEVSLAYDRLHELKKVAKEFGVSQHSLRKYFIENKIPYKKKIRYICKDNFFDFDNEKSFYWAGMLAADGNVSKQNDISLSLAIKDIEHVLKFKKDIESDSPVSKHITKPKVLNGYVVTGEYARFRIRSHYMAQSLLRFNVCPAKSKVYSIPDFIGNSKYFKHYLRGYFDGDGWFSQKASGRIALGLCGTKEFIEKINFLIIKNIGVSSGSIVKQKSIYKLSFEKQHDVYLISKFMYENSSVYLNRKYNIWPLTKISDEATIILNIDKKILEKLYIKLRSYKKVAEKLNCSVSVIAKYIRKYNIIVLNTNKKQKIRNINAITS